MKKFCFIQPEFKTVHVNNYTTENDYVNKASNIYEADINFSQTFNDFIKLLLSVKVDMDNKFTEIENKERLIFIFIDDIDLSTQRSVDVVKTLLTYISHPRIITVISGDLNTFEEALTLDFLRKEKGLSEGLLNQEFVDNSKVKQFLARKKELSYEYLKKILPPQYRYNVKKWSDHNKGDYHISLFDENKKEKPHITLSELLYDCFNHLENPPIFKYYTFKDNQEKELKNIPEIFSIFDSSSRGLNNIYNILLTIREKYAFLTVDKLSGDIMEKSSVYKYLFEDIKILLETIVVTSPDLNSYRGELLENILNFGADFNTTNLNMQGFYNIMFENYTIEFDIKFKIFIFIDFVIRILNKSDLFNEIEYIHSKALNIAYLINKSEFLQNINSNKKSDLHDEAKKVAREIVKEMNQEGKILNFLDFQEVIIVMQYIRNNLGSSENLTLYNFIYDDMDYMDWLSIFLYKMVISKSLSIQKNKNKIIYNMVKNNSFGYQNYLNDKIIGELPAIVSMIFDDLLDKIISFDSDIYEKEDKIYLSKATDEYISKQNYDELLFNSLAKCFDDKIFIRNFLIDINDKKEYYHSIAEEEKEILNIIFAINKYNLFSENHSEQVIEYVKKRIILLSKDIKPINLDTRVDINNIKDSYNNFVNSYKGSSNTLAKQLEKTIKEKVDNSVDYYISFKDYILLKYEIFKLSSNKSASYGVLEAQIMLNDLKKSEFLLSDFSEIFYMWLHIYGWIKISKNPNIYDIDIPDYRFLNLVNIGVNKFLNEKREGNSILAFKNKLINDVSEETLDKFFRELGDYDA